MASKKERKAVFERFNRMLDNAERALLQDAEGLSGSTAHSLEALKTQYETVNVTIKKQNRDGEMALFLPLENQSPKTLIELGLDNLCLDQGGGGKYEVWIQAPGGPRRKYWSGSIMGTSFDLPKAKRDVTSNPFGQMMAGPGGAWTAGAVMTPSGNYHLPDQYFQQSAMAMRQNDTSMDRMMAVMQNQNAQQQQSADRTMQMLLALVAPQRNQPEGPSAAELAMREELREMRRQREEDRRRYEEERRAEERRREEERRRYEQERREEERRRYEEQRRQDEQRWQQQQQQWQQQLADQKNDQMIQLARLDRRGDKDTGALVAQIMGNNQQMAQQQQLQYVALLEKVMDRPSEGEKIGELANVMLNTQMGQMQLMTTAMQSGLFGGGQSDHPILDAVKEGIRAFAEMGQRGLGQGQPAPGYEEAYDGEYYQMPDGQAQVQQPQQNPYLPQQYPPQQLPGGAMAGVPMQGPNQPMPQSQQPAWQVPGGGPQPQPQQPQIPPEAVVTEEDLERIEKDRALVPVAATIMRGDDPVEIPMRLFVYATQGGSHFAQKWLAYPMEVTSQVCQFLDVSMERAQEILDTIIAFINFVTPQEHGGQGRDPNEWGGDYAPSQRRQPPQKRPAGQPGGGNGAPLGVTQGVPPSNTQAEEYDPSRLPDGMTQEQAEAQAQEAAKRAMEAVKPNTEMAGAQAPAVDPAARPS
jgi:hypothetical protein